MLRKLIGLVLLATLLVGCRWESDTYCDPSSRMLPVKPDEETWAYQEEIIREINTFATEIGFYHQIYLENSYAMRGDDGLYYLWLDFNTQVIQDLTGARRLIVYMVNELLERLNGNAVVLGAQNGMEYTTDNLYLSLEYTSFYASYDDHLMVARSEMKYGYMDVFYAGTAFQIDPCIYHKHSEPFETSNLIVKAEIETERNLETTGLSIFDKLSSPVDWMSGQPDYARTPRDVFDPESFRNNSTISNFPKDGRNKSSGKQKDSKVHEDTSKEKSSVSNWKVQNSAIGK